MTPRCRLVRLVSPWSLVCLLAASPGAQAPPRAETSGARRPTTPSVEDTAPPVASAHGAALQHLKFRELGPAAMGGRIDDVAVVESNPDIVYVGTASGGLWKTTNGGTTWTPIFDKESVSSVGDVTVAPSDPSIVWVGTGEPNNRQSSSWGNGVYKSTDAGQTWRAMGLRETQHIGRIAIHPTNPDIVYVAALGRLWGPNKERGLFKTLDGGQTWRHVLAISDDTGVVDVAMDPASPDTLYAAAYQRRRTVFGFAGSGPEGGIHKTTDGGASWKRLTSGLPWDDKAKGPAERRGVTTAEPLDGHGGGVGRAPASSRAPAAADSTAAEPERQEIGRIGLAIYRRNPAILYAVIEHASGGVFRSDDRGETWRKTSDTNPRPMYYSKVHVDPTNDQRVWVLGASMYFSDDGGRSFRTDVVQRIHGDFHAMWIDPSDSDHMILGSDGGVHWSRDRGRTWEFVNTIAIGQFYEIGVDMNRPYRICGGLQDNNTWCGPSASANPRGVSNADWFTIGGGDGFYAQIDPAEPSIVYAESQDGNLLRRDLRTGESRSIRPVPAPGEAEFRFQWNSPFVLSAHEPRTIYYAGNVVFRSADRGDSWVRISPDLTTGADRNTMEIFGRVADRRTRSRHDGVRHWPAISTLAESPVAPGVLWAGTDDGLLHVTRDGGKSWTNVVAGVPGLPKGIYVSRIVASRHAAGTAYAAFDGHRSDDFGIYAYATSDFGETWRKITNGIPEGQGVLNVIREHHRNPDLLFAGGERGAFVSFTRGAQWLPLRMNLPTVPVDDIVIHPRENDLILGTHGRSIWILDDITPLEELTPAVLESDLHVFTTRPATQWRPWANTGSTGHKAFLGENPPAGVIINYYLKDKADGAREARIAILDAAGNTVRELTGPAEAGINRVAWDTRAESPIPPPAAGTQGSGGGGGGGFFGAQVGPRVEPGEYTIRVKVGEPEVTKTAAVLEDPRITVLPEDRAARRAALDKLVPRLGPVTNAQRTLTRLRSSLSSQLDAWKHPGAKTPGAVIEAGETLLKKIDEVFPRLATPPGEERGMGDAGPPVVERPPPVPQRLMMLYTQVSNYSGAPTPSQVEQVDVIATQANDATRQVRDLVETDLAALNRLANEFGIPHVAVPTAQPIAGSTNPER